ncbi:hypothetical protein CsatB_014197 [Cannabis sativa]
MKAYAIVLIVCGSVIGTIIIFGVCVKANKKKKQTSSPIPIGVHSLSKTTPTVVDVEKGEGTKKSSGTKDGNMVILAGAGPVLATAAVVNTVTSGYSGGCGGGGDGDGGGGGCGGGGCGGCGGCGG